MTERSFGTSTLKVMKNKARPGVYIQAIIFTLIFIVFGAFLPTSDSGKVLPILVFITWSMSNYFCRLTDRRITAGLLAAIFIAVIGSLGLSSNFSYLNWVDVLLAERSSFFSIGSTGKILVLLGACAGMMVMNAVIDSINHTIIGKPGILKRCYNFFLGFTGPITAIIMVMAGSKIQNVAEVKKTDAVLAYVETHKEKEVHVADVPTLDEYALAELETIKMREDAELATGKKKLSILSPDPLKPTVLQVGYGITQAEIDEAIHYGVLPEGTQLPKTLTAQQAGEWLVNITYPTYYKQVMEVAVKKKPNRPQFAGLFSFCHNTGKGNLKTLLKDRTIIEAADHITKYINVITYDKRGKKIVTPYKGLLKNRLREQALLLKTEDSLPPPVAPEPPTLL